MSRIRYAENGHLICLRGAIRHLKQARDSLSVADCPKTLARVRKCLKSAEGAERHMWHRLQGKLDARDKFLRGE